jgi:hypothetical protein
VILGRGKAGEAPKPGFVVLGDQKTCSRKAAEIDYDKEKKKFVVKVLGKNGILVNCKKLIKGDVVELGQRSSLKIGPYKIYFLVAVRNNVEAAMDVKLGEDVGDVVVAGKPASISNTEGSQASRFRVSDYKGKLLRCFQIDFKDGKSVSISEIYNSIVTLHPGIFKDRIPKSCKQSIKNAINRYTDIFEKDKDGKYRYIGSAPLGSSGGDDSSNAAEQPSSKKKRRVELTQV